MVVLLMGTTGAGKTTVGKILAARLRWTFLDADDFHPQANIDKMHHGIPLTDADRLPWLEKIHTELLRQTQSGKNIVLACSALKQSYRDLLSSQLEPRNALVLDVSRSPQQLAAEAIASLHLSEAPL